MDTIHLLVQGTEFHTSRQVLEQSLYLKELLALKEESDEKDDILKIDNITPLIFQCLVASLTTNINIPEEIALLYDFLNIDRRLEGLEHYHCKSNNCNKISIDYKYCDIHRCKIKKCCNEKINNKYCEYHNCVVKGCTHSVNVDKSGEKYCKQHTCVYNDCIRAREYGEYCNSHVCCVKKCNNLAIGKYTIDGKREYNICKIHKCDVKQCYTIKGLGEYCKYHTCLISDCPNIICNNNMRICTQHKCEKCRYIKTDNSKYCYRHKMRHDYPILSFMLPI